MAVISQNGEDRREDRVCLCQIRYRPVVQTRYCPTKRARCYAALMYKSCDGAEWSKVGVYLEKWLMQKGMSVSECTA
jgi:hypothetical protein